MTTTRVDWSDYTDGEYFTQDQKYWLEQQRNQNPTAKDRLPTIL